MHYPIVGDSCVYNLLIECTFDFCRGIHVVYELYRHTLFHGCEGVTFYYTEPKHKKKVTFKMWVLLSMAIASGLVKVWVKRPMTQVGLGSIYSTES